MKAALINVVQSFDPASAATDMTPAQEILDWVKAEGLAVEWVLDTHPHADHLMASSWLREQTGAPNAIGEKVREIAGLWRELYHIPDLDPEPHFDRFFAHDDTFKLSDLEVRVMLSPGHTLGSVTYVIGDAAFAHDTFMQPDAGTARGDFPGGSAAELYDSLQAILALPDQTRIFIGHDYGTKDRDAPAWESTVAEQRVVYAKPPFGGPEQVLAYLSRFTHRIAISNSRLVSANTKTVAFRWTDYRIKRGDRMKVMRLDTNEFIRRFLMHVLPDGFHRIRHYGLLASAQRKVNIAKVRAPLGQAHPS